MKGYSFHRLVETNRARENKEFEVILQATQPCLYPPDND